MLYLMDRLKKQKLKLCLIFNLEIPTALPGVDPAILDPRDTYSDPTEWEKKQMN